MSLAAKRRARALRELLLADYPGWPRDRFDCDECGKCIASDEDGCCASCGGPVRMFLNGKERPL